MPANALVVAANNALADKDFRDCVRAMHANGYPLVAIVDALGLEDDMTRRIRQIVEELPPDVVAGIRDATLAMLDSHDYEMPVDCTVTDAQLARGLPIDVEVVAELGRLVIRVRARVGA